MRVSSIAIAQNTSFNGKLCIRNKISNTAKFYKTSREADAELIKTFKDLFASTVVKKNSVEQYLIALKKLISDNFINELPEVLQPIGNKMSSSNSRYTSFVSNDSFTQLKTQAFEISHDLK